jgi:hypothetical protein
VRDSGEDAPVYNLRIADYHTYFVGADDWGFSVWAHNWCTPTDQIKEQLFERAGQSKTLSAVRGAFTELLGGQTQAAVRTGRVFDHITKVRNAMRGLVNRIEAIKRLLRMMSRSQLKVASSS